MRRFIFAGIATTLVSFVSISSAQDTIAMKNGQEAKGKIVGVANGQVQIEMQMAQGTARMQVALDQVKTVKMAPPPAYEQALKFYEAGEYAKAANAIRPVVDQFKGLPVDWAEKATSLLGDAFVELNQLDRAQTAYAEYQKLYPGAQASVRLEVAKAKLALADKKNADAEAILTPLVAKALEAKAVSRADGATYGQVFLLLGQLRESQGKLSEALENYLRTVTVFYYDRTATATAQGRADELRNQNPTLTVP